MFLTLGGEKKKNSFEENTLRKNTFKIEHFHPQQYLFVFNLTQFIVYSADNVAATVV